MEQLTVELFDTRVRSKKNDAVVEKSLRLRKLVYCDELKYEEGDEYEVDMFDISSIGVLISIDGEPVATCRLLLKTALSLPSLVHTKSESLSKLLAQDLNICEISRFLIRRDYRANSRRQSEERYSALLLSLYGSLFILFKHYSIDDGIFMCERSLIRKIRSFGIDVELVDEAQYFHKTPRFICRLNYLDQYTRAQNLFASLDVWKIREKTEKALMDLLKQGAKSRENAEAL